MRTSSEHPYQTARALAVFTLWLVMAGLAAGVLLIVLGWIMPWLSDTTSAAAGLSTLAVAAAGAAAHLRRRNGVAPSGGRAWVLALLFSLVVMALQALAVWAVLRGPGAADALTALLPMLPVFGLVAVVQILALRIGLWLGAGARLGAVAGQPAAQPARVQG